MTRRQNNTRTLLLEDDGATTAGGYFVANYPPFDFWSSDQVGEATRALAEPPTPDALLGLYVHIPFCRKRCHFCYFRIYTDRNAGEIKHYLDALIREMRMYADQPIVAGRPLRFVYFGGGTPSYLSDKQLKYLTDGLKEALPWGGAAEVAFECEPGTLNDKKLHAIRAFGVTRLSLGVENFDDEILKLNNRAHESKQVYAAYNSAKQCGFDQLNIDLIAGMLGETESNWRRNIETTLNLAPECVTIYQMEVPFNTTIYKQMRDQGRLAAPVADWATKRRWVREAFDELERAGYTVTSAYTAVRDPKKVQFVYRDALWSGADMIALGVSSFGHLNGVHVQNESHIEPYIQMIDAGRPPIRRAIRITAEQRMIREFILQMKLGRVNRTYFLDKFSEDVFARFADVLDEMHQHGLLSIDGDELIWSRQGLMQVDRLLPLFFLDEHRQPPSPSK